MVCAIVCAGDRKPLAVCVTTLCVYVPMGQNSIHGHSPAWVVSALPHPLSPLPCILMCVCGASRVGSGVLAEEGRHRQHHVQVLHLGHAGPGCVALRPPLCPIHILVSVTCVCDGTCAPCLCWCPVCAEKFRSINTLYYRSSAAAVVVYDITSKV